MTIDPSRDESDQGHHDEKKAQDAYGAQTDLALQQKSLGDVESQRNHDDLGSAKTEKDSEAEYPGRKEVVAIMLALLFSVFLVALDRTILATAIPRITDEFHSIDDIGWYGSAYMLTNCAFQLLIGRLYTFYTPKYVYLALILTFEIGSAICGAAPNSIALIIGRAIAGLGAAGVQSGAAVMVVSAVPLAKIPKYQGIFGFSFGIASAAGPLLGGAFTTNVNWRWCFYINLPIGGVAMLIILLVLQPKGPVQKGVLNRQILARLDLLGELFLFPCVVCLLLALQWGGSTYNWSNGRIIALFVLFGALLIGFILAQAFTQKTATIPARVVRNRSMIGAMWYQFCIASSAFLIDYYMPIWFQAIKGVPAVQSGIRTIAMILPLTVGSIIAGQATSRVGYCNPFMYASSILMAIGAGLYITLDLGTSAGKWIGYQILFGFATGIGIQQGAIIAQTVLDKIDVPVGITIIFFLQSLGGAVFLSVGENVFETRLVRGLTKVLKNLNAAEIFNAGATNLRNSVPKANLRAALIEYNLAIRQTFIVATTMASLAIFGVLFVRWTSVKGTKKPA